MQEGQQFDPSEIAMTEHETTPPELLSMSDLLTLMERHEIGTDATMGQHIETIQVRAAAHVVCYIAHAFSAIIIPVHVLFAAFLLSSAHDPMLSSSSPHALTSTRTRNLLEAQLRGTGYKPQADSDDSRNRPD